MADKIIPASPSAEDYAKAAANSPDDGAWFARNEPFALFAEWLEDAKKTEPQQNLSSRRCGGSNICHP